VPPLLIAVASPTIILIHQMSKPTVKKCGDMNPASPGSDPFLFSSICWPNITSSWVVFLTLLDHTVQFSQSLLGPSSLSPSCFLQHQNQRNNSVLVANCTLVHRCASSHPTLVRYIYPSSTIIMSPKGIPIFSSETESEAQESLASVGGFPHHRRIKDLSSSASICSQELAGNGLLAEIPASHLAELASFLDQDSLIALQSNSADALAFSCGRILPLSSCGSQLADSFGPG
jgi:hypothetical protein